ncbi:hypothetical protein F511_31328 [Dorcoceras hygrometricum]|uniref:CCHC-type domain-containing protein n=1 Tax=Dorcoceras hygrometricum TaxID=472368 RepID=A0A2Z7D658_9LAMI|nr:hypothetical protein F511_31328 [Dorcoceras hygrometricum]
MHIIGALYAATLKGNKVAPWLIAIAFGLVISTDLNCYNCGRPGHFAASCNRPKKDDKKKDDRSKKDDRRSTERRRTRSDKRPNRKNDRKVLVAEESNKNWADSDSETTSSSSSSSDSEQEEVHCLMANQTTEDEVFDFSNTEFTREDLINALNKMVHEYRKLSQTFEEIKAENGCLKSSSVEPSTAQLGESDSLQTELSKLRIENESLRNKSCELTSENEKLNEVMSSWTKSSVSLSRLQETQKPLNYKSGLGFYVGENSSSVTHDTCESVKYDDQISPKLNYKGKAGIGYTRPENNKPNWLKNRLDKDKAKAGSKSFVPNHNDVVRRRPNLFGLDWSRREYIQARTVKGCLSWTGRRYQAGTVRGRPNWFGSLLPEVQGTSSWFISWMLEQHEDQAQSLKSSSSAESRAELKCIVEAQNAQVQNSSSVDQVQCTRAVIECEAVYKSSYQVHA